MVGTWRRPMGTRLRQRKRLHARCSGLTLPLRSFATPDFQQHRSARPRLEADGASGKLGLVHLVAVRRSVHTTLGVVVEDSPVTAADASTEIDSRLGVTRKAVEMSVSFGLIVGDPVAHLCVMRFAGVPAILLLAVTVSAAAPVRAVRAARHQGQADRSWGGTRPELRRSSPGTSRWST